MVVPHHWCGQIMPCEVLYKVKDAAFSGAIEQLQEFVCTPRRCGQSRSCNAVALHQVGQCSWGGWGVGTCSIQQPKQVHPWGMPAASMYDLVQLAMCVMPCADVCESDMLLVDAYTVA
jgi:hypothetical protein